MRRSLLSFCVALVSCQAGGSPRSLSCVPISCGTGGACGTTTDGCGKTIDCPDCIDGKADLSATWSPVAAFTFNTDVPFALTVKNNGPASSNGASLSITVPGATWTCTSKANASCPSTSGAGVGTYEISNFPGGSQIELAFTLRVAGAVGDPLIVTATVAQGQYPDPDSTNNSATLQGSVAANPNAPSITAISGQTSVRQGGTAQITVTGTHLDSVTNVSVGSLPANVISQSATTITASFTAPHGTVLDPISRVAVQPLSVTSQFGRATSVGAVTITGILASPGGNDANSGSSGTPVRSMKQALSLALDGDTVVLDSGTYDEAHGEVWATLPSGAPFTKSVNILGSTTGSSILSGPAGTDGKAALIINANVTLSDLEVTELDKGIVVRGGQVQIHNVRAHHNTLASLDVRNANVTVTGASTFNQAGIGTVEAGIVTCGSGSLDIAVGTTIESNGFYGIYDNGDGCDAAPISRALTLNGVTIRNNLRYGIQLTAASGPVGDVTLADTAISNSSVNYGLDTTSGYAGNIFVTGGSFTGNTTGGVRYRGTGNLSIDGTSFVANGTAGTPGNAANVHYAGSGTFTMRNTPAATAATGDYNILVQGSTGPTHPSGPVVVVQNNTIAVAPSGAACAGYGALRLTGTTAAADVTGNHFTWASVGNTSCPAIQNTVNASVKLCGTTFDYTGVAHPVPASLSAAYADGAYQYWFSNSGVFSNCP